MYCGKQAVEEFLGRLLVDVVDLAVPNFFASSSASVVSAGSSGDACAESCFAGALALFRRRLGGVRDLRDADLHDGQQPLNHQSLRNDRLEFVVDDVGGVDLLVNVAGDDVLRKIEDAPGFELEQACRDDRP